MEKRNVLLVKANKILLGVVFINLCSINVQVLGYGSGAPNYACKTMIPIPCHGHDVTSLDLSAFSIDVSPKVIKPNSKITIILKAKANKYFRGFIVTAFKTTGSGPRKDNLIGTFHGPLNSRITCQGKGITQRENRPHTTMKFTWDPPASMSNSDKVVFNVTFVEVYNRFWKDLSPAELTVSSFPDDTSAAPTTVDKIVPMNSFLKEDIKCGVEYSCFHDCVGGNCSFTVSWKDKGIYVAFHMKMVPVTLREIRMAVGFSYDKKIGDDSVTECMVDSKGAVQVYNSYSNGTHYQRLNNKVVGLSNMEGTSKNGVLECWFDRNKTSAYEPMLYDLDKDWYVMFIVGDALAGRTYPRPFKIAPHVSSCLVDLQTILTLSVQDESCILTSPLPGV